MLTNTKEDSFTKKQVSNIILFWIPKNLQSSYEDVNKRCARIFSKKKVFYIPSTTVQTISYSNKSVAVKTADLCTLSFFFPLSQRPTDPSRWGKVGTHKCTHVGLPKPFKFPCQPQGSSDSLTACWNRVADLQVISLVLISCQGFALKG